MKRTTFQMQCEAIGRRIKQFIKQCEKNKQPTYWHTPEGQHALKRRGLTVEEATKESVGVLLRVKPKTMEKMIKGDTLNPWAWMHARRIIGRDGHLPSWAEAKAIKGGTNEAT